MMQSNNKFTDQFAEMGFCEGSFSDCQSLESCRSTIIDYLQKNLHPDINDLRHYHNYVQDETQHRDIHYELSQLLSEKAPHQALFWDNQSIFSALLGLDIDIQVSPYLRISRPGLSTDNIGFHRDTFYGNSAFEVSCVTPLVDLEKGSEVFVMPQSQSFGPLAYDVVAHDSIEKGSKQNQIGFLYSTKKIKNLEKGRLYGPTMKRGQFLLFSLGVIHGQEINSSNITRWSIDFRLRPAFAPMNKNLKPGYYTAITRSPTSRVADTYYRSNPNECADLNHSTVDSSLENK